MKEPMYKVGRPVRSMNELAKLMDDGKYVMLMGKPKHHGWIISMQFRTLQLFLARKSLCLAVRNPKHNGNAQSSPAVERHNPHPKNR